MHGCPYYLVCLSAWFPDTCYFCGIYVNCKINTIPHLYCLLSGVLNYYTERYCPNLFVKHFIWYWSFLNFVIPTLLSCNLLVTSTYLQNNVVFFKLDKYEEQKGYKYIPLFGYSVSSKIMISIFTAFLHFPTHISFSWPC